LRLFANLSEANGQMGKHRSPSRRLFISLTDTSLARGFGAAATTTPRKVDLVNPTPIGE
jgi:hypothetical protein